MNGLMKTDSNLQIMNLRKIKDSEGPPFGYADVKDEWAITEKDFEALKKAFNASSHEVAQWLLADEPGVDMKVVKALDKKAGKLLKGLSIDWTSSDPVFAMLDYVNGRLKK